MTTPMERYLPQSSIDAAIHALQEHDPSLSAETATTLAERALMAAAPGLRRAALTSAVPYLANHGNHTGAAVLSTMVTIEGLNSHRTTTTAQATSS